MYESTVRYNYYVLFYSWKHRICEFSRHWSSRQKILCRYGLTFKQYNCTVLNSSLYIPCFETQIEGLVSTSEDLHSTNHLLTFSPTKRKFGQKSLRAAFGGFSVSIFFLWFLSLIDPVLVFAPNNNEKEWRNTRKQNKTKLFHHGSPRNAHWRSWSLRLHVDVYAKHPLHHSWKEEVELLFEGWLIY